jgi:hypothetical protein
MQQIWPPYLSTVLLIGTREEYSLNFKNKSLIPAILKRVNIAHIARRAAAAKDLIA